MSARVSAIAAVAWLFPAIAAATAQRTFVASDGADANPCTLAQPCRSFAAAIAQTTAGGEVLVLDSAGYGPATITKAVSIITPPGVYAGISVPSGSNGITVSAGVNDVVVLRGLSILGQGGQFGVLVNSAKEVHVEKCTISNMQADGVNVNGGGYVRVAGTTLRSNGINGLYVSSAVTTTLMIDETQALRNGGIGFYVNGAAPATFRNSVATGNASHGVRVSTPAGAPAVTITNGEYSGNGTSGIHILPVQPAQTSFSMFGASVSRNGADGVFLQAVNNPGPSVVSASISASSIAWNGRDGVLTNAAGFNQARTAVFRSAVHENGEYGVYSLGSAQSIVSISANSIARNAEFDVSLGVAGVVLTFGNNALTGNGGADVSGSMTSRSLR